MEFEGWVANATGNLSFNSVGSTLAKAGVLTRATFWHPNRRFAVVAQQRSNPDRLLAPRIAPRHASSPKGEQELKLCCLLTARSEASGPDAEGALRGTIHLLPRGAGLSEAPLRAVMQMAARLEAARIAYRSRQAANPPNDVDWQALIDGVVAGCSYSCDFLLLRNGKCFLETKGHLTQPTLEAELASQCYYFLKDCLHKHYHHSDNSDGIIEITPIGSAVDWRMRTLRNLYRKVIELRRSRDERRLSSGLGVLAYAEAFRQIFEKADFAKDGSQLAGVRELPAYTSGLEKSIQIRKEEAARGFDGQKLDAQFFITSSIAVLALIVSLNSEFSSDSLLKVTEHSLTTLLGDQPWLLILVPALTYGIYTQYTGRWDFANIPPFRWLYKLVASTSKRRIVTVGASIVLILTAIGAYAISKVAAHYYQKSVSGQEASHNRAGISAGQRTPARGEEKSLGPTVVKNRDGVPSTPPRSPAHPAAPG